MADGIRVARLVERDLSRLRDSSGATATTRDGRRLRTRVRIGWTSERSGSRDDDNPGLIDEILDALPSGRRLVEKVFAESTDPLTSATSSTRMGVPDEDRVVESADRDKTDLELLYERLAWMTSEACSSERHRRRDRREICPRRPVHVAGRRGRRGRQRRPAAHQLRGDSLPVVPAVATRPRSKFRLLRWYMQPRSRADDRLTRPGAFECLLVVVRRWARARRRVAHEMHRRASFWGFPARRLPSGPAARVVLPSHTGTVRAGSSSEWAIAPGRPLSRCSRSSPASRSRNRCRPLHASGQSLVRRLPIGRWGGDLALLTRRRTASRRRAPGDASRRAARHARRGFASEGRRPGVRASDVRAARPPDGYRFRTSSSGDVLRGGADRSGRAPERRARRAAAHDRRHAP